MKNEFLPRFLQHCVGCLSLIVVIFLSLSSPAQGAVAQALPPIILISVDTLRADRLSCYGYRGQPTPQIDSLAQGGTLFSQVGAQVPLTLPSHVSLLSSTYPFFNGVYDNGQHLGPETVMLASVLKSQGYRTAAFVGGFVLDRRFGLHQGFDLYDSPFDLRGRQGTDPGEIHRWGEDVVLAATRWLEENAGSPFFVFLHLYDLHTPYDPPPPFRKRLPQTSYENQLRYVDEVLERFWAFLRTKDLLGKALIVFASDHGEGLGDHGEGTHGYFVYQSTLRVPLIIRWPARTTNFPARVEEPVSLLDVAPTILQVAGLQRPIQFQGRSLLPLLSHEPSNEGREVYSESYYARDQFACSSLQSLRTGHYKYIEAPKPELYDLAVDPGETRNLLGSHHSLALSLRERLLALRSRFHEKESSQSQSLSPEDVAALSSLGYVAAGKALSASTGRGPDPKDRIVEFERLGSALALASSGRLAEANARLQRLRAQFPEVAAIAVNLGLNHQKLGQHIQAADYFRQVLKQDPLHLLAHFNLAVSLYKLGQPDEAIKELQATLTIAPYYIRAEELLGTIWSQKKDYQKAEEHFRRMLTTAPEDYTAHHNLGVLAAREGKVEEAEHHLRLALKSDPKSAEAHNSLGSLYFQTGDLNRAQQAFAEAIRLDPKLAWAHYNLGLVLRRQKVFEEARLHFRQALAADPKFSAAREALDRLDGIRK